MYIMTDSSPVKAVFIAPLKRSLRSLIVGAMLITPVSAAYALEDTPPNQDSENLDQDSEKPNQDSENPKEDSKKLNRDSKKLKRQILASLDDPEFGLKPPSDEPQEPDGNGFRISKKGPIQYRRTLQLGDDEVLLKIYGPVAKKKPGLRFRIEGLRVGDHPIQVDGFGNAKAGGLRFTVQF